MFPKTRDAIAQVGIGFALLSGMLGMFITFVPGAEAEWFGVAAASAAVGIVSPSWRVRGVAVIVALGLAWFVWNGYQNGLRYEEYLRQRNHSRAPSSPSGKAPDGIHDT